MTLPEGKIPTRNLIIIGPNFIIYDFSKWLKDIEFELDNLVHAFYSVCTVRFQSNYIFNLLWNKNKTDIFQQFFKIFVRLSETKARLTGTCIRRPEKVWVMFKQNAGRRVEIHASFYHTHHSSRSNTRSPRNKCDGQFAGTLPPQFAGVRLIWLMRSLPASCLLFGLMTINFRKVTDPYFYLNLICTCIYV